eukprot:CFRG8689
MSCTDYGSDCTSCLADASCGFCASIVSTCYSSADLESKCNVPGDQTYLSGGECPAEFLNANSNQWMWIGIGIGIFVLLIVIIMTCCWCRKRRLRKFDKRQNRNNERFAAREEARATVLADKKTTRAEQHDAIRKKYNMLNDDNEVTSM